MKLIPALAVCGALFLAHPQDDVKDLERRVARLERELDATSRVINVLIEVAPADARKKALTILEELPEASRIDATRALVEALNGSLKIYRDATGAWPESGNTNLVKALQSQGPTKAPYFEFTKRMLGGKGEVVDYWGRPLIYRRTENGYELYSCGPNGKDEGGKGDDIR